MIATKLWSNPCWLSFRANFIAHHFNQPIYEWIWRRWRLTPPEHVVLYALGLKEGITAEDIAASSSRPKNTLSRAIKTLLAKRLVTRVKDARDRRRMRLYLTPAGLRLVEETVPRLVAHEEAMTAALTHDERTLLDHLLTKTILGQSSWPSTIDKGRHP